MFTYIYDQCKSSGSSFLIKQEIKKYIRSYFEENENAILNELKNNFQFFSYLKKSLPLFSENDKNSLPEEQLKDYADTFSKEVHFNIEMLAYRNNYKPNTLEIVLGNYDEETNTYSNKVDIPDGRHKFIVCGYDARSLKWKGASYRVLEEGYFEVKNGTVQPDSIINSLSFTYLYYNNHTYLEKIEKINDTLYELVFGS